jgi:hypothetical protein
MDKKYFIFIFASLFVVSAIAVFGNNPLIVESFNDSSKDKIKTAAQNLINETNKKAEEITPVITEKVGEVVALTAETIKEKGGEAIGAMIVDPATKLAKDLLKKTISSASSSLLTTEDIKEILKSENNSCSCK